MPPDYLMVKPIDGGVEAKYADITIFFETEQEAAYFAEAIVEVLSKRSDSPEETPPPSVYDGKPGGRYFADPGELPERAMRIWSGDREDLIKQAERLGVRVPYEANKGWIALQIYERLENPLR